MTNLVVQMKLLVKWEYKVQRGPGLLFAGLILRRRLVPGTSLPSILQAS